MTMNGTVLWFQDKKGFGFIKRDDGKGDVFVHFSQIEGGGHRTLFEGQKVEFEVVTSIKGSQAQNVKKIKED